MPSHDFVPLLEISEALMASMGGSQECARTKAHPHVPIRGTLGGGAGSVEIDGGRIGLQF